jgi:hypothetical protein
MSTRDDVAALERELAGLALDAKKVRAKTTTTRISSMMMNDDLFFCECVTND